MSGVADMIGAELSHARAVIADTAHQDDTTLRAACTTLIRELRTGPEVDRARDLLALIEGDRA